MLRCTVAGLIPLMNSERYAEDADTLFRENLRGFLHIIQHKSYYLLRTLPGSMAKELLLPVLPGIAAGQMKNGLWRGKDRAKSSYELLSAISHAGLMDEAGLKYSPLAALKDSHDEYALLVKRLLGEAFTAEDDRALAELLRSVANAQEKDGSFGETVTGTVIRLNRLLDLGMQRDDPVIRRGVGYLLSQHKPTLQGMHTSESYDLAVSNVFTTNDRHAEFQAAMALRPEWLPRHVCFHTMAMIPNAVCLNLLLRLGLESDPGVSAALQSLYALYRKHGGFCATDIKKPYL